MTLNYQKTENWKTLVTIFEILITVGTVGFGVVQGSQLLTSRGDELKNSHTANLSQIQVFGIGKYECDKGAFDEAQALRPGETERGRLETVKKDLEVREEALNGLREKLAAMTVDAADQAAIDRYNTFAAEYNTQAAAYEKDLSALNTGVADFNKKSEAFDVFLKERCTQVRSQY